MVYGNGRIRPVAADAGDDVSLAMGFGKFVDCGPVKAGVRIRCRNRHAALPNIVFMYQSV
jgi:hypothetical protein